MGIQEMRSVEEILASPEDEDDSRAKYNSDESSATAVATLHADHQNLLHTGYYYFSLGQAPTSKKQGWRAGTEVKLDDDEDSGAGAELVLALPEDAGMWHLYPEHACFNILADTGAFAARNRQPYKCMKLGSAQIVRDLGFQVLRDHQSLVTIGDLEYRLIYTVTQEQEGAFQSRKAHYMTHVLKMEEPIEHTLITTSLRNITVGSWTILKTAGTGSFSVVKAAINTSGESAAVHMLLGWKGADHDPLVAHHQNIKEQLSWMKHADKVLTLRDVVHWPDTDPRGDTYLLSQPLARGDFYNFIMCADPPHEQEAIRQLFAQACAGISALHTIGYVHCDIKPANLAVVSLKPPRAVVLDL